MIEENKHCSEVIKKHFNKELVMTIEQNEDFRNSTKCWICGSGYIDNDVEVRDHCHIIKHIEVLHIETVISILN